MNDSEDQKLILRQRIRDRQRRKLSLSGVGFKNARADQEEVLEAASLLVSGISSALKLCPGTSYQYHGR